ncbi:MAG TPA: FAD-dependent oxidoreductase, partial [Chitinophagales bacterium]|nr:FAD-dependent oxidoreductase [Chitinophagales bacterium]
KRVSNIETLVDHQGKQYENGDLFATDKHVVVIGGGDTGSDCVGTSNRHGAASITQMELLSKPPLERAESTPWPMYPLVLRTSSSHDEGCQREWSILTKEFLGDENGNLSGIKIAEIEWKTIDGKAQFVEKPETERIIPCQLALLAMGFLHPQHDGLLAQLGVEIDERGNVKSDNYQTNIPKVFAAGDMRRGQSLVVWAISEGRECAYEVDKFLMGESLLERKSTSMLALD